MEEIQLSTSQWKYRQDTTHLSREGQEVRRSEGREFHGAPGTCDLFFFLNLKEDQVCTD